MKRIRLTIEYDGTNYAGWQIQAQGERTIQAELERAAFAVTGEKVRIMGAGRTDAGVHALGQVAHFDTQMAIEPPALRYALNANLPGDIAVVDSVEAAPEFDARHDAKGKIYRYFILNRPIRSPLLARTSAFIHRPLDKNKMKKAAKMLLGEHDFKSFQSTGTPVKSTLRCIHSLTINDAATDLILIEFFATAYLKQMVRNIVGTLVQIGLGRIEANAIEAILDAKDRSAAGPTAPACGLTMVKVFYPFDPPPDALLKLVDEKYR